MNDLEKQVEGLVNYCKAQQNEPLDTKMDFYKNFKSIHVRCTNPNCGKIIEVTKVVLSCCDNWDSDIILSKKMQENGEIELSNTCVTACEHCEYEQDYYFNIIVDKQHRPRLKEASNDVKYLNYSNGFFQLIYNGENYEHDSFLDQLKSGSLIVFHDVHNFFNLEEPTVLKGHYNPNHISCIDGGYWDSIAPHSLMLEDGVVLTSKENAKKYQELHVRAIDEEDSDEERIFPQNVLVMHLDRDVLIIPKTLIKTFPATCNIYDNGNFDTKEEKEIEF